MLGQIFPLTSLAVYVCFCVFVYIFTALLLFRARKGARRSRHISGLQEQLRVCCSLCASLLVRFNSSCFRVTAGGGAIARHERPLGFSFASG